MNFIFVLYLLSNWVAYLQYLGILGIFVPPEKSGSSLTLSCLFPNFQTSFLHTRCLPVFPLSWSARWIDRFIISFIYSFLLLQPLSHGLIIFLAGRAGCLLGFKKGMYLLQWLWDNSCLAVWRVGVRIFRQQWQHIWNISHECILQPVPCSAYTMPMPLDHNAKSLLHLASMGWQPPLHFLSALLKQAG